MPILLVRKTTDQENSPFTVRVKGKGDLQITAPTADEAIWQLVSENRKLWRSLVGDIRVTQTVEGYLAYLENWSNDVFGYGATEDEARGALVRVNGELFKTEVVIAKKS